MVNPSLVNSMRSCRAWIKQDDVYRVEKILRRKEVKGKKTVLVKWLGYDSKQNSGPRPEVAFKTWGNNKWQEVLTTLT